MALTALEALREIQAQLAGDAEQVPDGWMHDLQWAKETGLARVTVANTLLAGFRAGVVERKKFRIRVGESVRAVWHYRQIAKPAKKK